MTLQMTHRGSVVRHNPSRSPAIRTRTPFDPFGGGGLNPGFSLGIQHYLGIPYSVPCTALCPFVFHSHDTVRLNETISEGKMEARQLSLTSFQ